MQRWRRRRTSKAAAAAAAVETPQADEAKKQSALVN